MNKRKRSGVMLAKPLTEKLLSKMDRYILQPKLRGIRCRASLRSGENIALFSSTDRSIISMPHIQKELSQYAKTQIGLGQLLDGELYHHGWTQQHINSVVLRNNTHPEIEQIEYHIYDTITNEPQDCRLSFLHNLEGYPHLEAVPLFIPCSDEPVSAMEVILHAGHEYVKQGYEGVIVRDADGLYETKRSNYLLKWKPKYKEYFEIVGLYNEVSEEGEVRAKLGALGLVKDGQDFRCGGGRLSHAERRKAWVDLCTRRYGDFKALVVYPELTERGVPSQPILLRIERR